MTPHQKTKMIVAALVARMTADTSTFNVKVTQIPPPEAPTVITGERLEWANTAFLEEMNEFNQACHDGDPLEAADALIDLAYFALGRLGEMGVPAAAIWEAVQAANMLKEQGELAKRPGSQGHDAVKPKDWVAPKHVFLLNFTLADVEKARLFSELSPVFQRITKLRAAKGADYNNVPGGRDAYFPFGHASYAHMINTKSLRIQSIVKTMATGGSVNFEGLKDSVEDLINYSAFYVEAMESGSVCATGKVSA